MEAAGAALGAAGAALAGAEDPTFWLVALLEQPTTTNASPANEMAALLWKRIWYSL